MVSLSLCYFISCSLWTHLLQSIFAFSLHSFSHLFIFFSWSSLPRPAVEERCCHDNNFSLLLSVLPLVNFPRGCLQSCFSLFFHTFLFLYNHFGFVLIVRHWSIQIQMNKWIILAGAKDIFIICFSGLHSQNDGEYYKFSCFN